MTTARKIIITTVVLSFLLPHFSWAFDPGIYQSQLKTLLFNQVPVTIPEKFGTIRELIPGDRRLVIHIQDLHCNYEVQKNIAAILSGLTQRHGLWLVAVEGASRPINPSKIRSFPLKHLAEEISDYFVRQGKLSGAEYVAATQAQPLRLEGVEDAALYRRNQTSVRLLLQEEGQGLCCDLQELLNSLKPAIYTPDLAGFDQKCADYSQGKIGCRSQALFLRAVANQCRLDLAGYPAFAAYLRGQEQAFVRAADPDALYAELDRLEYQLRPFFYSHPLQAELDQWQRRLRIMEKLLNISASQAEVEEFRNHREGFRMNALVDFIRRHGAPGAIDPEIFHLDRFMDEAADFYAVADQRSRLLAKNTLARMAGHGQNLAVLITGGYHTPQVLEALAAEGVSCVSIQPRLTHQDLVNPYFNLLRDRQTPLEKLLAKNQTIFTLEPYLPQGGDPEQAAEASRLTERERVFSRLLDLFFKIRTVLHHIAKGRRGLALQQAVAEELRSYPDSETDIRVLPEALAEHPRQAVSFPVQVDDQSLLAVAWAERQAPTVRGEDLLEQAALPGRHIGLVAGAHARQVRRQLEQSAPGGWLTALRQAFPWRLAMLATWRWQWQSPLAVRWLQMAGTEMRWPQVVWQAPGRMTAQFPSAPESPGSRHGRDPEWADSRLTVVEGPRNPRVIMDASPAQFSATFRLMETLNTHLARMPRLNRRQQEQLREALLFLRYTETRAREIHDLLEKMAPRDYLDTLAAAVDFFASLPNAFERRQLLLLELNAIMLSDHFLGSSRADGLRALAVLVSQCPPSQLVRLLDRVQQALPYHRHMGLPAADTLRILARIAAASTRENLLQNILAAIPCVLSLHELESRQWLGPEWIVSLLRVCRPEAAPALLQALAPALRSLTLQPHAPAGDMLRQWNEAFRRLSAQSDSGLAEIMAYVGLRISFETMSAQVPAASAGLAILKSAVDFYQQHPDRPHIAWLKSQQPFLKSFVFQDGGRAKNRTGQILRYLFESLPDPQPSEASGFPRPATAQDPRKFTSRTFEDLALQAGLDPLAEYRVAVLGRKIVFTQTAAAPGMAARKLVVKIRKANENNARLQEEALATAWMAAHHPNYRGLRPLPVPGRGEEYRFCFDLAGCRDRDRILEGLEEASRESVTMTGAGLAVDHEHYVAYAYLDPEETRLEENLSSRTVADWPTLEQSLLAMMKQLGQLAADRLVYTSLGTIFHTADKGLAEEYLVSQVLDNSFGYALGRLTAWKHAVWALNVSPEGRLRDLKYLRSGSDLVQDFAQQDSPAWQPLRSLLADHANALTQFEVYARYLFIFMLTTGAWQDDHLWQGIRWDQDDTLAPLANLMQRGFRSFVLAWQGPAAASELQALESLVDWNAYARQMAFWMSRSHVGYLQPPANQAADRRKEAFPGEKLYALAPGAVDIGIYRSQSWDPEDGMIGSAAEKDYARKARALGLVNSDLPVQEFVSQLLPLALVQADTLLRQHYGRPMAAGGRVSSDQPVMMLGLISGLGFLVDLFLAMAGVDMGFGLGSMLSILPFTYFLYRLPQLWSFRAANTEAYTSRRFYEDIRTLARQGMTFPDAWQSWLSDSSRPAPPELGNLQIHRLTIPWWRMVLFFGRAAFFRSQETGPALYIRDLPKDQSQRLAIVAHELQHFISSLQTRTKASGHLGRIIRWLVEEWRASRLEWKLRRPEFTWSRVRAAWWHARARRITLADPEEHERVLRFLLKHHQLQPGTEPARQVEYHLARLGLNPENTLSLQGLLFNSEVRGGKLLPVMRYLGTLAEKENTPQFWKTLRQMVSRQQRWGVDTPMLLARIARIVARAEADQAQLVMARLAAILEDAPNRADWPQEAERLMRALEALSELMHPSLVTAGLERVETMMKARDKHRHVVNGASVAEAASELVRGIPPANRLASLGLFQILGRHYLEISDHEKDWQQQVRGLGDALRQILGAAQTPLAGLTALAVLRVRLPRLMAEGRFQSDPMQLFPDILATCRAHGAASHLALLREEKDLEAVAIHDGGRISLNFGRIMRFVFENLPRLTLPTLSDFPSLPVAQPDADLPELGLEALAKRAGLTGPLRFAGRVMGRGLIFQTPSGERLVVKRVKAGEPDTALQREGAGLAWQAARDPSGRSPRPVAVSKGEYRFRFSEASLDPAQRRQLENAVRQAQAAAALAGKPFEVADSHTAIAYVLSKNSAYDSYLKAETVRTWPGLRKSLLNAGRTLGGWARQGIVHTTLADLFHNLSGGEREYILTRGLDSMESYSVGRLTAWQLAIFAVNLAGDGTVRDYKYVKRLEDVCREEAYSRQDWWFASNQFRGREANVLLLEFLARAGLVFTLLIGDWQDQRQWQGLDWEKPETLKPLAELLRAMYLETAEAFAGPGQGRRVQELAGLIDWDRYSAQMAFFMNPQASKAFLQPPQKTGGDDRTAKFPAKRLFGVSQEHLRFGNYRDSSWDDHEGFVSSPTEPVAVQRKRAIGAVNGSTLLTENVKASYYIFGLAIAERALSQMEARPAWWMKARVGDAMQGLAIKARAIVPALATRLGRLRAWLGDALARLGLELWANYLAPEPQQLLRSLLASYPGLDSRSRWRLARAVRGLGLPESEMESLRVVLFHKHIQYQDPVVWLDLVARLLRNRPLPERKAILLQIKLLLSHPGLREMTWEGMTGFLHQLAAEKKTARIAIMLQAYRRAVNQIIGLRLGLAKAKQIFGGESLPGNPGADRRFEDWVEELGVLAAVPALRVLQEAAGPVLARASQAEVAASVDHYRRLLAEIREAVGHGDYETLVVFNLLLARITRAKASGSREPALRALLEQTAAVCRQHGRQAPIALLAEGPDLEQLAITREGHAPLFSGRAVRNLLEFLPVVDFPRPEGLPELGTAMDPGQMPLQDLPALAEKAGLQGPLRLRAVTGRKLQYADPSGRVLVVKLAKAGENNAWLQLEAENFLYLRAAGQTNLPQPVITARHPRHNDYRFRFAGRQHPEQQAAQAGLQAASEASRRGTGHPLVLDQSGMAIAYVLEPGTVYESNLSAESVPTWEGLQQAFQQAAASLGEFAGQGLLHTSLTEVFHNLSDGRREYLVSRSLEDSEDYTLGRITHWRGAGFAANLSRDGGLRDFKYFRFLPEIARDPNFQIRDWAFLPYQFKDHAANAYLFEFAGRYLLNFTLLAGDWLEAHAWQIDGRPVRWDDDASLAPLAHLMRAVFITLLSGMLGSESRPELETAADQLVDWNRYARQMAFYMSAANLEYLRPPRRGAIDTRHDRYPLEKLHGLGGAAFRLGDYAAHWNDTVGLVGDANEGEGMDQRQAIGPFNGPMLLTEFTRAMNVLVGLSIARLALRGRAPAARAERPTAGRALVARWQAGWQAVRAFPTQLRDAAARWVQNFFMPRLTPAGREWVGRFLADHPALSARARYFLLRALAALSLDQASAAALTTILDHPHLGQAHLTSAMVSLSRIAGSQDPGQTTAALSALQQIFATPAAQGPMALPLLKELETVCSLAPEERLRMMRALLRLLELKPEMATKESGKTFRVLTALRTAAEAMGRDQFADYLSELYERYAFHGDDLLPLLDQITAVVKAAGPGAGMAALKSLRNMLVYYADYQKAVTPRQAFARIAEAYAAIRGAVQDPLTAITAFVVIRARCEWSRELGKQTPLAIIEEVDTLCRRRGQDPLALLLKSEPTLDALQIGNFGDAPSHTGRLMQFILQSLPRPEFPRASTFPYRTKPQTGSTPVLTLEKLAAEAGMPGPLRFEKVLGRGVVFGNRQGMKLVVKLGKAGESHEVLQQEAERLAWVGREDATVPLPVTVGEQGEYRFRFDFDSLEGTELRTNIRSALYDAQTASLSTKGGGFRLDPEYRAIGYVMPAGSTYDSYLLRADVSSWEELQLGLEAVMARVGRWARRGFIQTTPADLFHNVSGDRPYITTVGLGQIVARKSQHSMGRLDSWRESVRTLNWDRAGQWRDYKYFIAVSEMAALPELQNDDWSFLRDLVGKEEWVFLLEGMIRAALTAMLLEGVWHDQDEWKHLDWRSDQQLAPLAASLEQLFRRAAREMLGDRHDERVESFLKIADWMRLARQMAYWMNPDNYTRNLAPPRPGARDDRSEWLAASGLYPLPAHHIHIMPFFSGTYDSQEGFIGVDGRRRSLGPYNGPLPITEFATAAYSVFGLALAQLALDQAKTRPVRGLGSSRWLPLGMFRFSQEFTEWLMVRLLGRLMSGDEILEMSARVTAPLYESFFVIMVVGFNVINLLSRLPLDPMFTFPASVLLTNLIYALAHGTAIYEVRRSLAGKIQIVEVKAETWKARLRNWGRLYVLGLFFHFIFYLSIVLAPFASTPLLNHAVLGLFFAGMAAAPFFHRAYHIALLENPESMPAWLRLLGMMGAGQAAGERRMRNAVYLSHQGRWEFQRSTGKQFIKDHLDLYPDCLVKNVHLDAKGGLKHGGQTRWERNSGYKNRQDLTVEYAAGELVRAWAGDPYPGPDGRTDEAVMLIYAKTTDHARGWPTVDPQALRNAVFVVEEGRLREAEIVGNFSAARVDYYKQQGKNLLVRNVHLGPDGVLNHGGLSKIFQRSTFGGRQDVTVEYQAGKLVRAWAGNPYPEDDLGWPDASIPLIYVSESRFAQGWENVLAEAVRNTVFTRETVDGRDRYAGEAIRGEFYDREAVAAFPDALVKHVWLDESKGRLNHGEVERVFQRLAFRGRRDITVEYRGGVIVRAWIGDPFPENDPKIRNPDARLIFVRHSRWIEDWPCAPGAVVNVVYQVETVAGQERLVEKEIVGENYASEDVKRYPDAFVTHVPLDQMGRLSHGGVAQIFQNQPFASARDIMLQYHRGKVVRAWAGNPFLGNRPQRIDPRVLQIWPVVKACDVSACVEALTQQAREKPEDVRTEPLAYAFLLARGYQPAAIEKTCQLRFGPPAFEIPPRMQKLADVLAREGWLDARRFQEELASLPRLARTERAVFEQLLRSIQRDQAVLFETEDRKRILAAGLERFYSLRGVWSDLRTDELQHGRLSRALLVTLLTCHHPAPEITRRIRAARELGVNGKILNRFLTDKRPIEELAATVRALLAMEIRDVHQIIDLLSLRLTPQMLADMTGKSAAQIAALVARARQSSAAKAQAHRSHLRQQIRGQLEAAGLALPASEAGLSDAGFFEAVFDVLNIRNQPLLKRMTFERLAGKLEILLALRKLRRADGAPFTRAVMQSPFFTNREAGEILKIAFAHKNRMGSDRLAAVIESPRPVPESLRLIEAMDAMKLSETAQAKLLRRPDREPLGAFFDLAGDLPLHQRGGVLTRLAAGKGTLEDLVAILRHQPFGSLNQSALVALLREGISSAEYPRAVRGYLLLNLHAGQMPAAAPDPVSTAGEYLAFRRLIRNLGMETNFQLATLFLEQEMPESVRGELKANLLAAASRDRETLARLEERYQRQSIAHLDKLENTPEGQALWDAVGKIFFSPDATVVRDLRELIARWYVPKLQRFQTGDGEAWDAAVDLLLEAMNNYDYYQELEKGEGQPAVFQKYAAACIRNVFLRLTSDPGELRGIIAAVKEFNGTVPARTAITSDLVSHLREDGKFPPEKIIRYLDYAAAKTAVFHQPRDQDGKPLDPLANLGEVPEAFRDFVDIRFLLNTHDLKFAPWRILATGVAAGAAAFLYGSMDPTSGLPVMLTMISFLGGLAVHSLRLAYWFFYNRLPDLETMDPGRLQRRQSALAAQFQGLQRKLSGSGAEGMRLGWIVGKERLGWSELLSRHDLWPQAFGKPKLATRLTGAVRLGRGQAGRIWIHPAVLFFPAWAQRAILRHEMTEAAGKGHVLATLAEHAEAFRTWGRAALSQARGWRKTLRLRLASWPPMLAFALKAVAIGSGLYLLHAWLGAENLGGWAILFPARLMLQEDAEDRNMVFTEAHGRWRYRETLGRRVSARQLAVYKKTGRFILKGVRTNHFGGVTIGVDRPWRTYTGYEARTDITLECQDGQWVRAWAGDPYPQPSSGVRNLEVPLIWVADKRYLLASEVSASVRVGKGKGIEAGKNEVAEAVRKEFLAALLPEDASRFSAQFAGDEAGFVHAMLETVCGQEALSPKLVERFRAKVSLGRLHAETERLLALYRLRKKHDQPIGLLVVLAMFQRRGDWRENLSLLDAYLPNSNQVLLEAMVRSSRKPADLRRLIGFMRSANMADKHIAAFLKQDRPLIKYYPWMRFFTRTPKVNQAILMRLVSGRASLKDILEMLLNHRAAWKETPDLLIQMIREGISPEALQEASAGMQMLMERRDQLPELTVAAAQQAKDYLALKQFLKSLDSEALAVWTRALWPDQAERVSKMMLDRVREERLSFEKFHNQHGHYRYDSHLRRALGEEGRQAFWAELGKFLYSYDPYLRRETRDWIFRLFYDDIRHYERQSEAEYDVAVDSLLQAIGHYDVYHNLLKGQERIVVFPSYVKSYFRLTRIKAYYRDVPPALRDIMHAVNRMVRRAASQGLAMEDSQLMEGLRDQGFSMSKVADFFEYRFEHRNRRKLSEAYEESDYIRVGEIPEDFQEDFQWLPSVLKDGGDLRLSLRRIALGFFSAGVVAWLGMNQEIVGLGAVFLLAAMGGAVLHGLRLALWLRLGRIPDTLTTSAIGARKNRLLLLFEEIREAQGIRGEEFRLGWLLQDRKRSWEALPQAGSEAFARPGFWKRLVGVERLGRGEAGGVWVHPVVLFLPAWAQAAILRHEVAEAAGRGHLLASVAEAAAGVRRWWAESISGKAGPMDSQDLLGRSFTAGKPFVFRMLDQWFTPEFKLKQPWVIFKSWQGFATVARYALGLLTAFSARRGEAGGEALPLSLRERQVVFQDAAEARSLDLNLVAIRITPDLGWRQRLALGDFSIAEDGRLVLELPTACAGPGRFRQGLRQTAIWIQVRRYHAAVDKANAAYARLLAGSEAASRLAPALLRIAQQQDAASAALLLQAAVAWLQQARRDWQSQKDPAAREVAFRKFQRSVAAFNRLAGSVAQFRSRAVRVAPGRWPDPATTLWLPTVGPARWRGAYRDLLRDLHLFDEPRPPVRRSLLGAA